MTETQAVPAIDFSVLSREFSNTGKGNFVRVAYPPNGDTIFEVYRDSRFAADDIANRLGLFAPTVDIYKSTGQIQNKQVFLVVIYQAANGSNLPTGWNGDFSKDEQMKKRAEDIGAQATLVPLLLPITAAKALYRLTITDDMQDGVVPGEIDFETGEIVSHASNLLRMSRVTTGSGKTAKTEYVIQKIEKVPATIKAQLEKTKVLLTPEWTLTEIANDYKEYTQRRQAEANGSATNETAKPPVAAEDFM